MYSYTERDSTRLIPIQLAFLAFTTQIFITQFLCCISRYFGYYWRIG